MGLVEQRQQEVNGKHLAVVGDEAARHALRRGYADGLVLAKEPDAA